MEACGSAHYWARQFRAMGHEVKLTPPIYVKAYVKRGKNDAADAAAICEAMSRPNMRFVAVKSEDQQATLMAHKTRELLIKQRTMSVNALRGHLAEFGVIAAKGIGHVEELIERAAAADLPAMVQATLGVLLAQLRSLDAAIDELERTIVADHRRDPVSRLAASVPGVGALAASAILAGAPDPHAFKSGRDFAAWLGVTPKQNSTGGKEKLGSITKQGNRYIRRLLVLGAISVLRAAPKRKGALCDWLAALRAQTGQGRGRCVGQQARPDRLGDHHHRRGLPHLHLRQGLIPIGGNALERRTQVQEFGERDDDVMNDTARRSKTIGHSAMGQEPRARPLDPEPRVVGLHQGQRTQSAPTGRTYDRRPPAVHRRNKNACQGAVHI
jgi:transposase